jgi:hypothetical protein
VPALIMLARGMKEKVEPELKTAIDAGRLLMVTPFKDNVKRVLAETAEKRNRFMIELADEVVIGFASKGGMLESMIADVKDKIIVRLKG